MTERPTWEDDAAPLALLLSKGWKQVRNGLMPEPYGPGEPWPDDELEAYDYLFSEWDYCLAPKNEVVQ